MDVLTDSEITALVNRSTLVGKYNETVDPESAYEMLTKKLQSAAPDAAGSKAKTATPSSGPSLISQVLKSSVVRQMERTAGTMIIRSLLGTLGLGGRSRR
jgi:hypothetical protein